MKMTVNYLNFVFRIEVKAKSKYRIFNFVFQFIKRNEMALWVHGFFSIMDFNKDLSNENV